MILRKKHCENHLHQWHLLHLEEPPRFPPSYHCSSLFSQAFFPFPSFSLSFFSSKVTFTVTVEVCHQLHTLLINVHMYELALRFFLQQEYVQLESHDNFMNKRRWKVAVCIVNYFSHQPLNTLQNGQVSGMVLSASGNQIFQFGFMGFILFERFCLLHT